MPRTIANTLLSPFLYIANSVMDSSGSPTRAPSPPSPTPNKMTPNSSPVLKPTSLVNTIDQRRVVSDSYITHSIKPSFGRPPSPSIPSVATTSEDLSMESRAPLLSPSPGVSTPYSVKYIRAPQDGLFETPVNTDTSGDRSFSTPSVNNSASSASMDIFLGPQPMSYVHYRQRLLDEADDFDRSPCRPSPAQLAAKINYAVTLKPDFDYSTKARAGDTDTTHLSSWRQKQIKKFKPGRPVAGARERPIPTLHGPLSLPYARNPSGVDATIADQSSYMTHVFGLRGADTFDTKNHSSKIASNARTSRIPSDSTNRSASSSSYLSTGALSDFPPASSNAMKVPVMVRDSTQVIGLKKVASMDGSTLDLLLHTGNSNMLRPHVDIRSQLGIGKPLSPIPGSPPPAHSLNVGIDTAIHSANAPVWQGVTEQSDFVSLALIDPTTNAIVNVRVPKSQYSSALGGVPCEILSTASKSNPSHQNAASKADASANWRNRASALSSAHASQAHTAGFANSPPPVSSPHSPVKPSVEVLTVDQLSQKYGHMRVDPNTVAEKTTTNKKGEKPASETTSPAKMLADSTSRQINIDATPVKSMKRKNLRIATNKRISSPSTTRIKGTPGAGKLLKPVVTVETDTSVKPNATAATQ